MTLVLAQGPSVDRWYFASTWRCTSGHRWQAKAEVHEVNAVELAEDKIDKLEREAIKTAEGHGLNIAIVRLVCNNESRFQVVPS